MAYKKERNISSFNPEKKILATLILFNYGIIKSVLNSLKTSKVTFYKLSSFHFGQGGKLYFMEHVKEFSTNHTTRLRLQRLLTSTGFWPLLFDGCCLDRDMLEDVKAAGFADVDAKHLHVPMKNFMLNIISPHLVGIATK